jgi:hypothetical protein
MLLKLIKQNTNGHYSQPCFRPNGENTAHDRPRASHGPTAQQLTIRPPNRPAHFSLLGQICLPAAGRSQPSNATDLHPTADRAHRRNKTPQRGPPQNPSLISPFSSPARMLSLAAPGSVLPVAGDGEGRRRPAHGRNMLLPSSFSLFFSLPLCLCRAPATAGLSTPWPVKTGVDEGWRRPVRSCGRLLPPFCLLFLPLPLFPSPATKQDPESPAMVAAGEVAAPPLPPSPARAFTLG